MALFANPRMITGEDDLINVTEEEGQAFLDSQFENSMLGKILGVGIESPLKRGFESLKGADLEGGTEALSGAVGDLGSLIKNNPEQMAQLGSIFQDYIKRGSKGRLAAVEAATAPFTKGSITDKFDRALGGFDPGTDIAEGALVQKAREERDRQERARGGVAQGFESLQEINERNRARFKQGGK